MMLPYPVSASQMTGMSTASEMNFALFTISVIVNKPTSGNPRSAEVPDPVIYTALKPTDSAILACSAFIMKGATTIGPDPSISLNLAVVFTIFS